MQCFQSASLKCNFIGLITSIIIADIFCIQSDQWPLGFSLQWALEQPSNNGWLGGVFNGWYVSEGWSGAGRLVARIIDKDDYQCTINYLGICIIPESMCRFGDCWLAPAGNQPDTTPLHSPNFLAQKWLMIARGSSDLYESSMIGTWVKPKGRSGRMYALVSISQECPGRRTGSQFKYWLLPWTSY